MKTDRREEAAASLFVGLPNAYEKSWFMAVWRWTVCCCSPQRNLEDRMLPCCPRAYDDLLALALWSALFSAILKQDRMQEVFRLYTDVDDMRMYVAVWREAVLERIGVVLGTLNHEMSNRMLDSSSCQYFNLPMAV